MNTNIKRRVKRIRLSPGDFLYPLFEAITNAIDAIEEKGEEEGEVKIEVFRGEDEAVKKFIVRDNGIGFTNQNYKSFHEDGTEHKAEKGGLGEGRFTMLKAFKSVKIKSVYTENLYIYPILRHRKSDKSGIFEKKFSFTNTETDKTETRKLPEKESTGSTVTLENYLEEFEKNSKCGTLDIAVGIVEHFLVYFLTDKMPTVTIEGKCEQGSIGDIKQHDLQKIFEKYFSSNRSYDLKEEDSLRVYLVEMPADMPRLPHSRKQHKLNLCAHGRKVKSENLSVLVINLVEPIKNTEESTGYYLSAYLEGKYLDEHVNSWRDNFNFPTSHGEDEANPSLEEIKKLVAEKIEECYKDHIEKIDKEKMKSFKEHIEGNTSSGKFRHLLNYPERLCKIPPDAKDDELNKRLYEISYKLEQETNEEVEKLNKGDIRDEKHRKDLKKAAVKVHEQTESALVEYVQKRRHIVKMFAQYMEYRSKEKGEYHYEETIHGLIFPTGKNSDEVSYDNHNLWLLDERLVYHAYISSNQTLEKSMGVSSKKRPDILGVPFAYRADSSPLKGVVIFEFKRPGTYLKQDDYKQVVNYFEKIIEDKAKNKDGRPLNLKNHPQNYGYLVGDITDDMKKKMKKKENFKEAAYDSIYRRYDEDGFKLYLEVLTYEHLLENVNDRHRAFFEKLGIDPS